MEERNVGLGICNGYDYCGWYAIKLKIILQNKHVSDQLTVDSELITVV